MKITKTVTKEVEIIENIFCNKCGNSCIPPKSTPSERSDPNLSGLIEETVYGGWYSVNNNTGLCDGLNYTFYV